MIIECSHCHAKYQYDESRFSGKASKKIRCAKCQGVFEIHNPAMAKPAPAAAAAPAPAGAAKTAPSPKAREDVLDMTMAKKLRTVEEELPEELQAPAEPKPRDLTPRLPQGRRLSIAVIDGPDAGKVYRIEKPRVVIGRTGADLALNDAETSRNHAAVEIRDNQMLLQDLGSTNGTLVDGSKIEGQVELYNQAEFQIGSTTLMMIVTDDA